MTIKSITLILLVTSITLLTACQDKQAQAEAEKNAGLKATLSQKNNKVESADEIYKRLHGNNPNNYAK